MQALGFYLLLPLIFLLSILPLVILQQVSSFTFYIIYYFVGYRKKVVYKNLRTSLPQKTEKEIEVIAKKFYRIFIDTMFETIKALTLSHESLKKKCSIKNVELVNEALAKGRNVMLVPGHYGNWEWAGGSMAIHSSIPMKAAFKPLSNKYFNRLAVKSRSRLKIYLIPKKQLIKHLNENAEQTLLVLIADQSPNPKEHFWVKFLNQDTAVVTGMEKIARQYNYIVFYATIHLIKRGQYQITYKLLTDDPNSLPAEKLTAMFMEELEKDIINYPAPYLWSHRRWKLRKPEK